MEKDQLLMVVTANMHFPAITAQDVGREVYHGRHEMVRIIGDERSLGKIAWIFQRVPDMFEVQHQASGLVVRRDSRYTEIRMKTELFHNRGQAQI